MRFHSIAAVFCCALILPFSSYAKAAEEDAQIWFVRHAEAGNNVITTLTHHDDEFSYPLTAKGVAQANELVRNMKDENILKIYASARVRTIQTADAIAFDHGLPLELAPEMVEVDLGAQVGEENPYEIWASVADQWEANPDYRYRDGESLTELRNRVSIFVKQLVERHKEDNGIIVVVAHGGSIRMGVLPACENQITVKGIKQPRLDNTGVLKTRVEGGKLICESFGGKVIAIH
ncbi:MAG: hypothetical protein VR73_11075 [Gammaproteobacteria bacterium BRH_c0]|nr:MAG: hypothetical protein VR73_11075 [Gammaproteobacteria bacterium BRH_c0]